MEIQIEKGKIQGCEKEWTFEKDLWTICRQGCGKLIRTKEFLKNHKVCPKCDYHEKLGGYERVQAFLDEGSFVEYDRELAPEDPLGFVDSIRYTQRLEEDAAKTGLKDAIITGEGLLQGKRIIIGAMDFAFRGGSMGSVVGEKIARCFERGRQKRLPVVIFSSSGGARMQEGIFSLMQMANTSIALSQYHEAGLLFISVLCSPTFGGTTASFASLGDVIIAEPKALIGFAGRRVIEKTIHQKLPDDFQQAEFLLEHGFIDLIVQRPLLRDTIARTIRYLWKDKEDQIFSFSTLKQNERLRPNMADTYVPENMDYLDFDSSVLSTDEKVEKSDEFHFAETDLSFDIEPHSAKLKKLKRTIYSDLSRWERFQLARHPQRPKSLDYINRLFDDFIELHGDRSFSDDGAIIGGLAEFEGTSVVVIAQQQGRENKEKIKRNFGMPHPEGYRKARRLMRLAEKFHKPVITLIDTQGAYPGIEAEERGIGFAIARNLLTMSQLRVPIVSVIIGEGGSGGALGIGMGDRVLMFENAVYSVITPEGCAAILWRDSAKAKEACEALKLTATDLFNFGVIDRIIKEPPGGAHYDYEAAAKNLKVELFACLRELVNPKIEPLLQRRYEKYRRIGVYHDEDFSALPDVSQA